MYQGNGARQPFGNSSSTPWRVPRPDLRSEHPRLELKSKDQLISAGPYDVKSGNVEIARGAYAVGRITGPVQFINKLLDAWRLDRESAIALLGFEVEEKEMAFDILDGLRTLTGKDMKYRIVQLIRIRQMLWELFRNRDVENRWLRQTQSDLGNREPLSLLLEGSIENLLIVRQFVQKMAGQ